MLDEIVRFTRRRQRFAVTSHARPDGDSIGSSLGLAIALEQIGKQVAVVHADPVPHAYAALPGVEKICRSNRLEGQHDAVFVLECSSLRRTGVEGLDRFPVVNIDHHAVDTDYGDLNWLDPSASALGEMILALVKALGARVTPEIAENLYVALSTDTGSFKFSNTTQRSFATAAELVRCGAKPGAVAQAVYLSQPLSKVRLLAKTLSTLQLHPSGKIAWVWMTRRMLEETGADANETEGIVTHPLSIDGVMAVAFIREEGDRRFRISLRSKPPIDVSRVAEKHGGGGHANAAGLSMNGGLSEVQASIVAELASLLDE